MLTIYKASAGSGKTYTLAYEYIKLLLGVRPEGHDRYVLNCTAALAPLGLHPVARNHTHILAITFTNKAMAEMKGRIIKELDALAHVPATDSDDAPYAAGLMDEFGCSREALADTARTSLQNLLNDYGSFNVSTIDSFFQTVLRTFAREIDRQGDYRVELDQRYVLAAAMSMLFDDLNDSTEGASGRVFDWLVQQSDSRVREGKDFNPFYRGSPMYRTILDSLGTTFNERFGQEAADVHGYLADPSRMKAFTAELDRHIALMGAEQFRVTSETLKAIDPSELKSPLRSLMEGVNGGDGLPEKDSDKLLRPSSKYMAALRDGIEAGCYLAKAGNKDYDPLFKWYTEMSRLIVRRRAFKNIRGSLDGLWALSYINDYVTRFRVENNLILLADTNSLLRSIINEDETPFIYERIGQPLHHFLIDEFQDTSRMQWHNLKPLVANSLASMHESLIIGDVKQSIYRWRGADSSLLDTSVETTDFPGRSLVRGRAPGENTNYRSAHGIVRFNNTLFSRLARSGGTKGYTGIEQALPGNTAPLTSYITVTDLNPDAIGAAPETFLDPVHIEHLRRAGLEPNPENVALERLAAGLTAGHERGYRWRDMAVLCRTHADMGKVVDFLLTHYPAIQVMSDEALLVRNCASVKLIVGMMEMMDKAPATGTSVADNDRQREGTPDPAYRSRSDAEMLIDRFEYFISHGREPQEALSDAMDLSVTTAAKSKSSLTDDLRAIRGLAPANLVALVEAIIERKIPPGRRKADMPYIAAFVDTVNNFCNSFNPTLHAFLDFWQQKSGRITIGSGAGQDAVTVMTVHAAKGLEWDCVYIPLMTWTLQAAPDRQWFSLDELSEIPAELRPPLVYFRPSQSDLLDGSPVRSQVEAQVVADTADNLNIAYVAFTRAVRELHINMLPSRSEDSSLRRAMWQEIRKPPQSGENGGMYLSLNDFETAPGVFKIGSPTTPARSDKAAVPAVAAPPYAVSFSALTRQVTRLDDITTTDSALDPYIGDAPCDDAHRIADPVTPEASEAQLKATRRGLNLHAILARMRTLDDIDRAVAAEASRFSDDDASYYREVIFSAFRAHPDLTDRWFDPDAPRVLTEQPIFMAEREENFRPDRIVWTRDGHVDVIDYKFTSKTDEAHNRQVRGYISLLNAMGIENVRGYVWYPAMCKIVELNQ